MQIQQIDAHRARNPVPGFQQHVHTGTNITELNDLRDVLRYMICAPRGNGQYISRQARTQHDLRTPNHRWHASPFHGLRVAFRMRLVDLSLSRFASPSRQRILPTRPIIIMQMMPCEVRVTPPAPSHR